MNLSVLLVEDDRMDQRAFVRLVDNAALSFDYQIAESVQAGRKLLQTQKFDAALIDYHLPDGTGFDLLDAVPPHVAVIFVTGAGSEATAMKALRAGASDYLVKDAERIYLDFLPLTVERAVQQKRTERELRTLSQAVMSSSDAIYVTDLLDRITHVNRSFCDTYGYMPEEVIGRSASRLVANSATGQVVGTYDLELLHRRRDGSHFPVSMSRTLVKDDEGVPFAYVAVVRDFTQLKALITERDRLIEHLESFAHTVAHDLKSPASLVQSYASFLTLDYERLDSQEVRLGLASMENAARRMVQTIDALLLLASVDGLDEVPLAALDMSALIGEALSRLQHRIEHCEAAITVAGEFPVAHGYSPWVVEMLVNYVSNALKYGGEPPRVEIGGEPRGDGAIRIWVRDNGRGLTPDEQSQLFQPFKRLHRTAVDGHGLGLSIVRQIAERLGGGVAVTSQVGEGSEFSFILPAHAPADNSPVPVLETAEAYP